MELIKVRDENGLGLTVTEEVPEDCEVILGGMDTSPSWEEYLSDYTDEFKPHLRLIKKAIEDLGWVGYKADSAQGCYFGLYEKGDRGFVQHKVSIISLDD